MANRRKEIPSFVSIEVGKVRGIAESMEDAAWARWSKKALDDLTMGCVRNDVDPIVKEVYDKSKNSMDREYQRKKKWYEDNKKSPQDAPNGNAGVDMYDAGNGAASKSPTSCDTLTADGDIREDSQSKPDGSAITRNETRHLDALEPSANIYATRQAKNGEAATREGAEASNRRESGCYAPTTFSKNMRRVPQNEAPAHGFSGGRTAQGTMSRSPEAAAQSGKASALDSLPDKDGQSAKTRDNSASCRYAPPSCSPEDGNHYDQDASISTDDHQPEGLTGPSHGGSVASLEARESQALESQRRTGGSSVRGMSKVAQPPVRPRASFRNKEEFIQWAIDDGLDPVDADECWEATEERHGKDADGNTVKNMKAFARQWCRTRANNRRTA